MTIKQLSVFLENKTGRINDVTCHIRATDTYHIGQHHGKILGTKYFHRFFHIRNNQAKYTEISRFRHAERMHIDIILCQCLGYVIYSSGWRSGRIGVYYLDKGGDAVIALSYEGLDFPDGG